MTRAGPVRIGMIGGGEGAFIGPIHRIAASIAGNMDIVAGAFSSNAERSRRFGVGAGIAADRAYGDFREMIRAEAARVDADRIEAVAITAPNHVHAPAAIAALEAGLHVICDKPIADTLDQALDVQRALRRSSGILAVTYTYAGYPMVRQARRLVAEGTLGSIRRIVAQYTQGWLADPNAVAGNKQAVWRMDPACAGEGGAIADIGTHAANLVEYVTGQQITALCAELGSLPGRQLDDDGAALFRTNGGAKGSLIASQVCAGDANNLTLSVYADKGGLHWRQEQPDRLRISRQNGPEEIWHAGNDRAYADERVRAIQRTPAGHPEGYLEAFANLYRAFGQDVRAGRMSEDPGYATLEDALASMRFVRAVLESSRRGSAWVSLGGIEAAKDKEGI